MLASRGKTLASVVAITALLVAPVSPRWVQAASCNYQECTSIGVIPPVLIQKGVGQVLSLGDRGMSVRFLQKQLNKVLRSNIKVDGIFGTETLASVKKLQGMTGELRTGVVAPQTWAAALAGKYRVSTNTSLKFGDRGPLVKVIQRLLNSHGYTTRIDGVFGAETWRSVVAFKNEVGLSVNGTPRGVVTTRVWNALNLPHYKVTVKGN